MTFGKDWFWPDLVVLVTLAMGFWHGRKHGMSMELLPLIKLLIVVFGGAFIYKPAGDVIYDFGENNLQRWFCYFFVYAFFLFVMHLLFNWIKRALGEKLVGSDMFGSMEYYFGMPAGMVRFACYVIIALSLLGARAINYDAEAEYQKNQLKELGSNYFPSFTTIQIQVFDKSLVGKFARNHLKQLLIEPTPSEELKPGETPGSRRARDIEDASRIKGR